MSLEDKPVAGKLAIMGHIDTANPSETWPFAILITFANAEDCRRAVMEERCTFTFGQSPASAAGEETE